MNKDKYTPKWKVAGEVNLPFGMPRLMTEAERHQYVLDAQARRANPPREDPAILAMLLGRPTPAAEQERTPMPTRPSTTTSAPLQPLSGKI